MNSCSYSDDLMSLFLRRKFSCCFHYDVKTKTSEYRCNFPKEALFNMKAADPVEGLLLSSAVCGPDKTVVVEFYKDYRRAVHEKSEGKYIDTLIRANVDGKSITMSLAVQVDTDENGLACGMTGYMASVSDFGGSHQAKAPFPVDVVMKKMLTTKENFAVIQLDIIRFKLLNEEHGEAAGDAVLEYIRSNLGRVWGRDAVSARFGADIFTVFTEYSDINELEERIEKVCAELQQFGDIKYKFSFGIYLVNDKNVPLRTMTDNAAIARKSAKDNAARPIKYFEEKFNAELHNRHEIESEMQNALESGQFQVYLQPKCRIGDGKVIGAEALVRWIHPEKGVVPPDKFIPVFEANGFIEQLDRYVHTQVCIILRKWIDAGIDCIPVSVNVSRIYLGNPRLALNIKEIVEQYRIPIDLFQIEITETYENKEAEASINTFKDCGFTLLMDDFGSGYSSLNTLKNTRFDVIKLDREFFGRSMMTERGQKIVSHTIAMTNDIGLEIVAEGVETNEQADFLDKNGCKFAQGYLYSKPIRLDEFEERYFGRALPQE